MLVLMFELIETFGNNLSSNNWIFTIKLIIIVNNKMIYSIFEIRKKKYKVVLFINIKNLNLFCQEIDSFLSQ